MEDDRIIIATTALSCADVLLNILILIKNCHDCCYHPPKPDENTDMKVSYLKPFFCIYLYDLSQIDIIKIICAFQSRALFYKLLISLKR